MDHKIDTHTVKECSVEYTDVMDNKCYLTATEWSNGEGWTVNMHEKGMDQTFQLHFDALSALQVAIGSLSLRLE